MSQTEQAVLETKLVGDIKGVFYIPAYQRGYRWEKEHIEMLLNDIWENGDKNYSLQPVVVKKIEEDRYELIDGQQRTTTIYLILNYIKKFLPSIEVKFSLSYQTREKSADFLSNPDEKLAEDNIDFHHIYGAYKAIDKWFTDTKTGDPNLKAMDVYRYFGKNVKVIWYEVNTNVDSTKLFTRLNIGKIPLTNAELVKALFLAKDDTVMTDAKQLEIATSWDLIEKELQDDRLWYFLTNHSPEKYATRIELVFDFMANKKHDEKEKFFTFFHFTNRLKVESEGKRITKPELWNEIHSYFLILKEWFEKKSIYHKVGYLVAIGKPMQEIIRESKGLTKTQFENGLDKNIKDKLNLTEEKLLSLSYENQKDRGRIENVLLLHNVETVRRLADESARYSFDRHKGNRWSLEHIHAQQSEGLNKKEDQQEWLRLHKESLERLIPSSSDAEKIHALVSKIDDNFETITKEIFDRLFIVVFECLSEEGDDRSYIDSLSNMALLSSANNAALNNSTFDVKRNKVLELDRSGEYIPISTKRVFLKYYTDSANHQLHFWGEQDRKAYLDNLIGESGLLNSYLKVESKSV